MSAAPPIPAIPTYDRFIEPLLRCLARRSEGVVAREALEPKHAELLDILASVTPAFYGALAGQRAKKGVFITTSSYTAQATQFAQSVEGIVLVDGVRLAELMVDHEVGVTARVLKVPKVDVD